MSNVQTEAVLAEEAAVETEVRNIIEALIFASDEPMSARFIRSIVDDVNKDIPPAEQYVVNAEIVKKAVGELNRGYGRMGSGFRIIEIAGGYTYATTEQFSSWVGKLAKEKARRRLSPTAVETLAIIAYKQPIAKGEVEFIRGVNVDYIINALLEKDLIQITGRAPTPGRPLLYGTTAKFLEHFGLNDISDLPKPREISELINDTELEVDRRLLAEQQELEFREDLEKKMDGSEGSKNKPQRGTKISVPEDIQSANRARIGKTEEPSPPAATEGKNIEEGDQSSNINLTTGEAAVERAVPATENVIHEKVPDLPLSSDHDSRINDEADRHPVHPEEPQEKGVIEIDFHQPIETDPAPVTDRMPDEQPDLSEPLKDEPAPEEATESVQDRLVHQEISAPSAELPSGEPRTEELQTEETTGWSKWKNKVKTFFQKLFA